MAVLPLVIAPDDRLKLCSAEIPEVNDEIRKLADDMLETMYHKNGLGLAAVQIGVHKRMFVAHIPDQYEKIANMDVDPDYQATGGPFVIINPKIIELATEHIPLEEGCLSLPEQRGEINRPKHLTLKYLDYHGNEKTIKAQGWLARCFLHEIDHLNGILFINNLSSKLKIDMALKKAKKLKKYYTNE